MIPTLNEMFCSEELWESQLGKVITEEFWKTEHYIIKEDEEYSGTPGKRYAYNKQN